jgi:hypothetical protein
MQTIDLNGQPLSLGMFIRAYGEALKLAPGRFLTLRVFPRTWELITLQAEEITHVVHQQEISGPLGRRLLKVACVPAPNAIGEGITVERDEQTHPTELVFEIHGSAELYVKNFAVPFEIEKPELTECQSKLLQ